MVVQIYGTLKCPDTRKAERFFKERRVDVQFFDLRERALSPGELQNIARTIPVEELIDTEGRQYQKRNLKYMKFDIAAELLADPLLLKAPIVRFRDNVTVGYHPEIWATWITDED